MNGGFRNLSPCWTPCSRVARTGRSGRLSCWQHLTTCNAHYRGATAPPNRALIVPTVLPARLATSCRPRSALLSRPAYPVGCAERAPQAQTARKIVRARRPRGDKPAAGETEKHHRPCRRLWHRGSGQGERRVEWPLVGDVRADAQPIRIKVAIAYPVLEVGGAGRELRPGGTMGFAADSQKKSPLVSSTCGTKK